MLELHHVLAHFTMISYSDKWGSEYHGRNRLLAAIESYDGPRDDKVARGTVRTVPGGLQMILHSIIVMIFVVMKNIIARAKPRRSRHVTLNHAC